MASVDWPTLLIGAIPGCIALGAALVGYGKLMQEVRGLAGRIATVEGDVRDLRKIGADVARIDERTKATADTATAMNGQLNVITAHLLEESRSFARPDPPPRRR